MGPAPELRPLLYDDEDEPATSGVARRRWAALIRRVYETDPLVLST